jgi:hypothetical protein
VIPLLQARGFNVAAAQLPLTSLADDIAAVKRTIDRMTSEHSGPVVLVGHSYGGAGSRFSRGLHDPPFHTMVAATTERVRA